jgi:hypothetical protein
MSKLALAICDWNSRQPVGDESPRGVLPAGLSQTVKKRMASGCCSPALPQTIPSDARLGEVRFIAPHTRGGDCFDRSQEGASTSERLKF